MIDCNNILLITDYEEIAKLILENLVLLRENDSITVCNTKAAKKILEDSMYYVVILHELDNEDSTIKLINNIKTQKADCEILLLLNSHNKNMILNAYDAGIYDYFYTDTPNYEMLIKTVNCFKARHNKEELRRNEMFLNQLGVIDTKTKLYNIKYLKEVFLDLSDATNIQNGIYVALTLDDNIKTKVSTNRLAITLKNSLRKDDIIATGKGGKFYLILPNNNLQGTKAVIEKLQSKMGKDFKIHAGLTKIGINSFDTINKTATDALTSAIQKDKLTVNFDENLEIDNSWLEDNQNTEHNKKFKLFNTAFSNKLENIITPIFYRYQKECETKLKNTQIYQYTNNIECVFSLKNKKAHSELILRYDGFTKINIEINHSGLDSPENSKNDISLNKITEKEIIHLLKQLKEEFIQST